MHVSVQEGHGQGNSEGGLNLFKRSVIPCYETISPAEADIFAAYKREQDVNCTARQIENLLQLRLAEYTPEEMAEFTPPQVLLLTEFQVGLEMADRVGTGSPGKSSHT